MDSMDILDRINALTDDQLQMIVDRDDASGVLASYRLAELRGLPMPERSAAVMGEGYVIIARNGKIVKLPVDTVSKIIREENNQFCVYSQNGERSFGCYDTRSEAEERLRQIHYFRAIIREGTFVSWNSSGGRARGQVEHVMYEGVLGIPNSDFKINAEPDNPAVLIRIWRNMADGWQATETLVGHKMSTLTPIEPLSKQESFKPPKGVQDAGKRALEWISQGHAGANFTDVGRARAAQLARGDNVSADTVRRMRSFLARHGVNRQKPGWNFGDEGFPSGGRVAWDAWGGDAAVSWVERIVAGLEKEACPVATQDVKVNLANRAEAISIAMYGPMNPNDPSNDYWEEIAEVWDVNIDEAQSTRCGNCAAFDITPKMRDCIAEGIGNEEDPYDVIDAGDLGYCRAFKFKCAANRTCTAWIAGGPITEEEKSTSLSSSKFLRKEAARRFTLGPLYVPDFMDAHGEWTDADELQQGVWQWVQSGDRTIYRQHDRETRAGEWVEVMTMPQPWTVQMMSGDGESIGEVTYPAGTVFLGVIWDEDSWGDILAGKLRGYSIGGFSDRVMADLPTNASRDGIELDE